jgi:integrase
VKGFLAWRKSKGFDPGTTLYTDRVILHNFFNRLKIENPVKEVPKLATFRKRPIAHPDADLKKFFQACTDWERAFFSLLVATGLRRGEMQTLQWSDLDLARCRVHVTAKPQYGFTPKDWEERSPAHRRGGRNLKGAQKSPVKKQKDAPDCPLVFPSPKATSTTATSTTAARKSRPSRASMRKNGTSTAFAIPLPPAGCAPGLMSGPYKPGSDMSRLQLRRIIWSRRGTQRKRSGG